MFGQNPFTPVNPELQRLLAVWAKGVEMPGRPRALWQRDYAGRAMYFYDHGKRSSDFGWEIGHIRAKALGGSDDIINLRPEHWRTNSSGGGLIRSLLG